MYSVDPDALRAAHGMARCHNCGSVFNAMLHNLENPDQSPHDDLSIELDMGDGPQERETIEPELDLALEIEEPEEIDLPFDVPEDLPALKPSGEAALDVRDSLQPRAQRSSPWWQKLLVLLLLITLALQLLWFMRADLLQYPPAQPLCQWLDCEVAQKRDTAAFKVIERQLQSDPGMPGALRLQLRFRNGAEFAQALPRLQLSLFDSSGALLARRTLETDEYLFPAPAKDALAAAQEVFTIELLFEDPGARASGFKIDFL